MFSKNLFYLTFLYLLPFISAKSCDFQGLPLIGQNPILPNVFQVNVEINIVNQNRSVNQKWYFDGPNRKAAVEIKQNDAISKYIFNYETNEVYEITAQTNQPDSFMEPPDGKPLYPSVCTTYNLVSFTPNEFVDFGALARNSTYILPYQDSSQIFKFNAQAYNGTDIVNGIYCDVYLACIYDPKTKKDYLVTYYFSKKEHTMPSSDPIYNRIPVRAVFSGNKKNSDNTIEQFEYCYEFSQFRSSIDSSNVFQTPSTVFCTKRKVSKALPPIKKRFSYSEEIVTSKQVLYVTDVHYAYKYNLLRYDARNTEKAEISFNSQDPITYISDYSIGVQYGINQRIGNCSVRGIRSDDFGQDTQFTNSLNQSGLGFSIRLKSPETFLDLDSEYIYTGKRNINGIRSHIYMSNRSLFGIDMFYEYSFSESSFNILSNYQEEKQIPVSVSVNIPEANFKSRTNFHNFDTGNPSLKLFDLSQCYKPDETILMKITVPYKINSSRTELESQDSLEDKILNMLYDATSEAAIRFSRPSSSISSKDGHLYIVIKIFPRPPPLSMFAFYGSFYLPVAPIQSIPVKSAEQCAAYCIENIQCLSFDFAKYSQYCYLNKQHITQNITTNPTLSYFDHYSRNTVNGSVIRESFQLFYALKKLVDKNELTLEIDNTSPCDNLKSTKKKLIVSDLEQINSTLNRYGTTSLLSNYKLKIANSRFTKQNGASFTKISVDDCAKQCNEQIGFECKSFDFCYINGDCSLNLKPAPEIGDNINNGDDYTQAENCDIYEKDALFHYIQFDGKALINKADKKIESIKTPTECASKCDNTKEIQCKSFNYCPNSKFCFLSEIHLIDASEANTNDLICDHYSRKYPLDFTYITTENILLDAEVILGESNLDQCSSQCVVRAGFNCKSFDYCPTSKTCLLNSGPKQIKENTAQFQLDDCGHYRRDYFYTTSINTNLNPKDNSESTLIGLSIVFSLVSVLTGFFIVIYFGKRYL